MRIGCATLVLALLLVACGGDGSPDAGAEDEHATPPWTTTQLTCNALVSVEDWIEIQEAWNGGHLKTAVQLKIDQGRYGQVRRGAKVRVMETRHFTVQGDTFRVRRIQTPVENLEGTIADHQHSIQYGVWVADGDKTETVREDCLKPFAGTPE